MKKFIRFCVFGIVGVAGGVASGCCGLSLSSKPVFGSQNNLVIFDPATNMEHFVRHAAFAAGDSSFDFVAPTPSKPELAEVSLQSLVTVDQDRRMTIPRRYPQLKGGGMYVGRTQKVGPFLATTLKATDSKELARYLAKEGFKVSPSQQRWLDFYVKKRWFLTAFKVAGNNEGRATSTIRMSFKTARPFNPFYVPESNHSKGATLSINVVTPRGVDLAAGMPEIGHTHYQDGKVVHGKEILEGLKLGGGRLNIQGWKIQSFGTNKFANSEEADLEFVPRAYFAEAVCLPGGDWWNGVGALAAASG